MRVAKVFPLFLILSTLLLSGFSHSQERPTTNLVPELKAIRINPETPQIDGNLDDEMWKSSKIYFARDFTQLDPDEGIPATESTVVSVVYDDDAVYFAFWNYDSEPDKIKAQLVRRDQWAESDKVVIRLDPYHDHQTGYRFEISAGGVQGDMKLFDDTNADSDWDGVWESAVKIHPWGWAAEVKIPYHCLRFGVKNEHIWGFNLSRYISRKAEVSYWAFSPSSEGGLCLSFRTLDRISRSHSGQTYGNPSLLCLQF